LSPVAGLPAHRVNGVDDSVLDERYFDTVIDFGEMWS
jgi:hypothetical protein